MQNRSLFNAYLSAFLATAATGGGWAITGKLAGHEAALSFLYFSAPVVGGMFVIQILLFMKSRSLVKFGIAFNIATAFGLVWMMSCLVLPIFWIASIGIAAKLSFGSVSLIICYLNVIRGIGIFNIRWKKVGLKLLRQYYWRDRETMDWGGIVSSLKLSASFYVPGVSEKTGPILSVLLVVSMIVGLSLRNVFPVFSVFFWGIPSVLVIATMLQMVGVVVGQYLMFVALEKKEGVFIRPL
ncbi:MAG: hypothetical protein EON58_07535 [Alphaproteobacteria bacterium]|nr:MAG: hypothetical protein EON58_07535 [Alphaproteobacteria bacterium]